MSERAAEPVTERDPARRAVALAFRRLLPILVLMHVIAYADRVNITFAETELTRDLAISSTVFGLAAGIFFAGYVALEIPSNLVLHRVGARLWMGRIMITWGIVAAATAFVWDGASLVVARILLGVGEAGFFPGVVYLIACWFPERDRARAMGVFMLGIVAASVIGGPLSGAMLELDGVLGLEGWQWLFLGQGVPAIAVGLWVLRALPGSPREASWLPTAEREALERELSREAAEREARHPFTLRGALSDRRILHCALVYFTINFASYGTIFWFADIVERIGDIDGIQLGLLAGIPMALGSAGLIVIGRRSDRSGDRRRWVVIGMLLGAAGLAGTALLPPEAGVLTLAVCAFGLLGAIPAFWAMPTSLLSGRAAAGGIALINTIGVTGGLFGPTLVGAAKDAGSLEAGLGALAAMLIVGAALASRLPFAAPRATALR
ncbi:MAG: transporter, family, tartrate transporter [Thermoleophilaceae bacterium]|nr:transporter, family, tartrate transporter [Thermoleophilaceae bacterium]